MKTQTPIPIPLPLPKKIMSILLTAMLVFSLIPSMAGAETQQPQIIIGFAELPPEVQEQTVLLGTEKDELNFPDTLYAVTTGGVFNTEADASEQDETEEPQTGETGETQEIAIAGVIWQSRWEYDGCEPGEYPFAALLPAGYELADGAELPIITVRVLPGIVAMAPNEANGLGYGDGGYAYEPPAGAPIADVFKLIDTYVDSEYENVAIVTFDDNNQFGAMWSNETLNLMFPFETEMNLHLGHKMGKEGNQVADGMTFTMHNNAAAIYDMVGGRGEGLGVFQGRKATGVGSYTETDGEYLDNSLVIEFDTYWNDGGGNARVRDPGVSGSSHCALVIPGGNFIDISDHKNTIYFTPTQEWVRFELEWTPNISGGTVGGALKYSFDGHEMTYDINDVEEIFGGVEVYWGFTGATGGLTALQAAAITKLPEQNFLVVKTAEDSGGNDIDAGIIEVGDTISYTITVTAEKAIYGIGPVIVTDELSPYVKYNGGNITVTTSDSESPSFEITPTFADNIMTVSTGHFLRNAGDWLSITFDVEVLEAGRGQIVKNTAIALAEDLTEPQISNTTEVEVINASRKLVAGDSAAGADGAAVNIGDEVTFRIAYVNNTGDTAYLTITDAVPEGMEYLSSTHSGAYDDNEKKVVWDIGSLADEAVGEVCVTMRVVPADCSVITNKAKLSWATGAGTEEENPEVVVPTGSYKIVDASSMAGVGGLAVTAGDKITYKIMYINNTGKTANLTVTDKIPAGMVYEDCTHGGTYDSTQKKVVWRFNGLEAGAFGEVTVTMSVAANAGPTVVNKAKLKWDTGGGDPVVEEPEALNPVMPYKIVAENSAAGANGTAVKAGDVVTFKIAYANNTGDTADLTITDKIPAEMEYVSSIPSGAYDAIEKEVVWDIGSLEAGAGGEVSVTMRIAYVSDPVIINKANLSWNGGAVEEEPEVILPVGSYKTVDDGSAAGVDGATVAAGDRITYKIVYINNTGETANLTITDKIPAGMEYVDCTDGGIYDSTQKKVLWRFNGLEAGDAGEVTVTMSVAANAGPTVINKAELEWDTGDGSPAVEEPEALNPVIPYKIVAEDSSAGTNSTAVKAGDEVTFKIAYANNTGDEAYLTIADEIPDGMEYLDSSHSGHYDETENKVLWDIGSLMAGADGEVSVTMRIVFVDGSVIINKAELSWDTGSGTVVEKPEVILPVWSYKIVDASSDAGVDGLAVTAGDFVTYKIMYINNTGKTADLTITDRVPAGMEYISSSPRGAYDGTENKAVWKFNGLAPGESGAILVTMRVAANAGPTVINKAKLEWDTGGDDPIEEEPEVMNPVIPYKIVDEDSTAGANGTAVKIGDEVTFKIAYANNTGDTAYLTITDKIPDGMEYLSSSHSGAYDETENKVLWDIGDLTVGAGGEVSVSMCVVFVDGPLIINRANLSWDTGGGTVEQEPEADVPVGSYKIVAPDSDAGADGAAVVVGDEVTYTLIYVNNTGEAADLVMVDEVPAEMEYVSSDGIFLEDENKVVWEFEALEPGDSGEGTVTLGVISNDEPVITNKADLSWYAGLNNLLLQEEPEADVRVGSYKTVDIGSEAGLNGEAVAAGEKVTYKIGYVNNTGETADLTITDEVPAGMEYVSSDGTYYEDGNKVIWKFDGIEAGAGGSVAVTMRVTSDAGSTVTNKAKLEWDAGGGMAEEEAEVTNPVRQCTVTYKANGGTGNDFIDGTESGNGYTVCTLAATGISRAGYTFTGWNTKADGSGTGYSPNNTITISGDVVLYAQWNINNSGGGGGGGKPAYADDNAEEDALPDLNLDIENHFAYIVGYPDGNVRPENNITRAEAASIFLRLLNQEYRANNWAVTNNYPDVGAEAWFNNAVSTLTNINILKGYPDGFFVPNGCITRAELASIAVRFTLEGSGGKSITFNDIAGHWAEDDIMRAAALGYVIGYPDGTFRPDAFITRAEVAALLNNVLNRHVEAAGDMPENMVKWPDNTPDNWFYFAVQEATNSHDYDRKTGGKYEKWIDLRPVPDWKAMERPGGSPYNVSY